MIKCHFDEYSDRCHFSNINRLFFVINIMFLFIFLGYQLGFVASNVLFDLK